MTVLSLEGIFRASVQIQLLEEHTLNLIFGLDGIHIKLPTTRKLAEYLKVPHYYVLPYFAMLEEQGLVTRAERVGVLTTPDGTKKFLEVVFDKFENEAKSILGQEIFNTLMPSRV